MRTFRGKVQASSFEIKACTNLKLICNDPFMRTDILNVQHPFNYSNGPCDEQCNRLIQVHTKCGYECIQGKTVALSNVLMWRRSRPSRSLTLWKPLLGVRLPASEITKAICASKVLLCTNCSYGVTCDGWISATWRGFLGTGHALQEQLIFTHWLLFFLSFSFSGIFTTLPSTELGYLFHSCWWLKSRVEIAQGCIQDRSLALQVWDEHHAWRKLSMTI